MSIVKFGVGRRGELLLESKTVNTFLRSIFLNTMTPYQRALNVFNLSNLTKNKKYIRHKSKTRGIKWQPYDPCNRKPTGSTTITSTEVTPCALAMAHEICSANWGNCLDYLDTFTASGEVDTSDFEPILNEILTDVANMAGDELWSTMLMGKYYSAQSGLTLNTDVPNTERDAHLKSEAECKGLVRYLLDYVPACDIFDTTDYTKCNSITDMAGLFERARCCARDKSRLFQSMVDLGYTNPSLASPVFIVSGNMYGQMTQIITSLQNVQNPQYSPWSRRQIAVPSGGTMDLYLYMNIPIVPVTGFNSWDWYYTDYETEFIALTVTGNIEIGDNFEGQVVSGADEPVGMVIQDVPDPSKPNTFFVSSTALIDVNVMDHDMIVWDVAAIKN